MVGVGRRRRVVGADAESTPTTRTPWRGEIRLLSTHGGEIRWELGKNPTSKVNKKSNKIKITLIRERLMEELVNKSCKPCPLLIFFFFYV